MGAKTGENSKKGNNTVYFQISVGYEQTSLALEFLMYNQINSKSILSDRTQRQKDDIETDSNNGKPLKRSSK